MRPCLHVLLLDIWILYATVLPGVTVKPNKGNEDLNENSINKVGFIWSRQTVATGDTTVLHCSFDAIFAQLRNGVNAVTSRETRQLQKIRKRRRRGQKSKAKSAVISRETRQLQRKHKRKRRWQTHPVKIDWVREATDKAKRPKLIAAGSKIVTSDRRYRVFTPHNSALSVLIIKRTKKRDAGIFKCHLSGSSTRHKFMVLNVTESTIEAKTSPARMKVRVGKDTTLWCNATGYPRPMVYWTREDRHKKLPDGTYQIWGVALHLRQVTEADTGIYACHLDNYVQPIVSYKFSLEVEDRPWNIEGYKMRFDSSKWYSHTQPFPPPVLAKSYLLMCETTNSPNPLPNINWYRNGKKLRNSRHYYIIVDKPEWRSNNIASTLVIKKFLPREQANFTCIARNSFRTKKREFNMEGPILTSIPTQSSLTDDEDISEEGSGPSPEEIDPEDIKDKGSADEIKTVKSQPEPSQRHREQNATSTTLLP